MAKPTVSEVVTKLFEAVERKAGASLSNSTVNAELAKHGYGPLESEEISEILGAPTPEQMAFIGPVVVRFLETHKAENLAELCERWNMNGDDVWKQMWKESGLYGKPD